MLLNINKLHCGITTVYMVRYNFKDQITLTTLVLFYILASIHVFHIEISAVLVLWAPMEYLHS